MAQCFSSSRGVTWTVQEYLCVALWGSNTLQSRRKERTFGRRYTHWNSGYSWLYAGTRGLLTVVLGQDQTWSSSCKACPPMESRSCGFLTLIAFLPLQKQCQDKQTKNNENSVSLQTILQSRERKKVCIVYSTITGVHSHGDGLPFLSWREAHPGLCRSWGSHMYSVH